MFEWIAVILSNTRSPVFHSIQMSACSNRVYILYEDRKLAFERRTSDTIFSLKKRLHVLERAKHWCIETSGYSHWGHNPQTEWYWVSWSHPIVWSRSEWKSDSPPWICESEAQVWVWWHGVTCRVTTRNCRVMLIPRLMRITSAPFWTVIKPLWSCNYPRMPYYV